jgi:hypothetical protein
MMGAGAPGEPFRLRTRYGVLALAAWQLQRRFAPMHACTATLCLPLGVSGMHVLHVASAAATLDARRAAQRAAGRRRAMSRPVTSADDLQPIQGCRYQGAETPSVSARTWYEATLLSCFLPSADLQEQRQVPSTAGYRQGE